MSSEEGENPAHPSNNKSDPVFDNQPPPAAIKHTYTFEPTLAEYNKPLHEILQLLLIRRSATEAAFPKMYEVPGGGAEPPPIDNTLLDSVARELFEETGLVATRIIRLVGTSDFEGRYGDKWRKFSFEVQVEDTTHVVLQPAEHDRFVWIGYEEFKKEIELGEQGLLWNSMPAQTARIRTAFEHYYTHYES
ncbi:hypothetical protein AA313_de0203336 [Arthrobotrys entomopaga]|nr:hypothetical protein AA313_de0203336 [Arthrobotrys entomopaga]